MSSPADELLSYLLGALDEEGRRRVEARLETDPAWQAEYQRLRRCLSALEEDGGTFEPPPGLTEQTCEFILHNAEVMAAAEPVPQRREPLAGRPQWTLVDVAMAATVFLAASLLLFPAVHHGRVEALKIACQARLKELGMAGAQYANLAQGFWPVAEPTGNAAMAGLTAARLWDAGLVSEASSFLCPGDVRYGRDERKLFKPLTVAEIRRASADDLSELRQRLGSYGYVLGVVVDGRYLGPRYEGRQFFALIADAPGSPIAGQPSWNHGQRGQNILFEDLRVVFVRDGLIMQKAFHNDLDEVGAGLSRDDACIASPAAPPFRRPPTLRVLLSPRSEPSLPQLPAAVR